MNRRIQLIMLVNRESGRQDFYEQSQKFGMYAFDAFKGEQNQERHRSQMTGLENIAETTLKVTDVLDFIKKQTAQQRGRPGKEPEGWKKKVGEKGELFGELLINYIKDGLQPYIDRVCLDFIDSATEQGKRERQEVYLELVRQFIRQLVVRYEYETALREEKPQGKVEGEAKV
jgi:hypothetical protein